MDIFSYIECLLRYGLDHNLFFKEDKIYVRNKILEILKLNDFNKDSLKVNDCSLREILDGILDFAIENNLIEEDSLTLKDIFDTKLMDALMPRPSEVIKEFKSQYIKSPKAATDYFYNLSISSNYIRQDRIEKDLKWKTKTKYADLDITINLSKPEKDPKEIALQKSMKSLEYPKCLLCIENEGYVGRQNHPPRSNHRLIPMTLNDEKWYFQYSPYVYYNEHCIVLNKTHTPMKIGKDTFRRLIEFTDKFPHYFIGSNADLPIVGGSILSHDHFQGGNYEFPMAKAKSKKTFKLPQFENVDFEVLNWPMTAIRLRSKSMDDIVEGAFYIFSKWQNYSDESLEIISYSNNTPHNTVTPIARTRSNVYELDIVLRNNRTTNEYPYGIFHPHENLHHIKKENIGLIEVMGLAVLPSRLKAELEDIAIMLRNKISPLEASKDKKISNHIHFYEKLYEDYKGRDINFLTEVIKDEVGKIFLEVLEDAGVFKDNFEGEQGIERFIDFLT